MRILLCLIIGAFLISAAPLGNVNVNPDVKDRAAELDNSDKQDEEPSDDEPDPPADAGAPPQAVGDVDACGR